MKLKRAILTAGLCLGLSLLGCGGSGNQDATVPPAPDRSGQISKLQQRKKDLERQIRAETKVKQAAAEAKTAEVGGDEAVNGMLARLPGASGLVIGAPGASGPALTGGSFDTGDAWSTIKVPISERVLTDVGGPEGLNPAQADEINRAITLSDNDAAAELFADLERWHGGLRGASDAVGEMLREAGDSSTVISTEGRDGFSTYGQTDWSLGDQFTYMAALSGGCVSDPSSRDYLLGQMASVGGSDTFGIGSAGFPARWKGGWGPGVDGKYLVRQMGVMDVNGKQVVIAMAAIPDDGSFESGQSMLSHIARWTASHLADQVSAPTAC